MRREGGDSGDSAGEKTLCDDKTKEPPLTQAGLLSFLLVSGRPIEEPVAWYGPSVMNTQEQLRQAMAELQTGKFIRHR